jgi:hypothetical protein
MLQYSQASNDIVASYKKWHEKTRGGLDTKRIDAWRRELSPEEIGLFEFVARGAMRRNGYEPSGLGERPTPALLGAYYAEYAIKFARIVRERAADARERRHNPQPLADLG